MRILVIEDNRDILANVLDYLQLKGYSVDCAQDGLGGLHLATTVHYDLIVLDIMLPDISAFDVCAKLKEKTALSATIVVVLSVKDNIEDITRAFHVGADDYIIKPPLPELLTRKIKLYLGIR